MFEKQVPRQPARTGKGQASVSLRPSVVAGQKDDPCALPAGSRRKRAWLLPEATDESTARRENAGVPQGEPRSPYEPRRNDCVSVATCAGTVRGGLRSRPFGLAQPTRKLAPTGTVLERSHGDRGEAASLGSASNSARTHDLRRNGEPLQGPPRNCHAGGRGFESRRSRFTIALLVRKPWLRHRPVPQCAFSRGSLASSDVSSYRAAVSVLKILLLIEEMARRVSVSAAYSSR
jgi:hypothetical protein